MKTLYPDATRIKRLRRQRGWPQEQLAEIAAVSPRTIQRIEAGRNASYETLRSVAVALDMDVNELLMDEPISVGGKPPDTPVEEVRSDRGHPLFSTSRSKLQIMTGTVSGIILLGALLLIPGFWRTGSVPPNVTMPLDAARAVYPVPAEPDLARPADGVQETPLTGMIKARVSTRAQKKNPVSRDHRLPERPASSASPTAVELVEVVLPGIAMQDSLKRNPQVPLEPTAYFPAGGLVTGPAAASVSSEPDGLSARIKNTATESVLSTSDAVQRSSKRMAGFFVRLGTEVKKSF